MGFKVKVIAHAISPLGKTFVAFQLRFPRIVLAEVNTHTVLGKCAQSSRAMPFPIMLADTLRDPYIPKIGAKGKGMVHGEGRDNEAADRERWLLALQDASRHAQWFHYSGAHKEPCNRLIEPWSWTSQVLSGTNWANFFAQRTHWRAHEAFKFLARAMWVALSRSTPRQLDYGEWAMPYITDADRNQAIKYTPIGYPDRESWVKTGCDNRFRNPADHVLCQWSAARCARVSYNNVDGTSPTPEKDFDTFTRLVVRAPGDDDPIHASPCWHQATPLHPAVEASQPRMKSHLSGWLAHRRLIPGETITEFNPSTEEIASWEVPEWVFE